MHEKGAKRRKKGDQNEAWCWRGGQRQSLGEGFQREHAGLGDRSYEKNMTVRWLEWTLGCWWLEVPFMEMENKAPGSGLREKYQEIKRLDGLHAGEHPVPGCAWAQMFLQTMCEEGVQIRWILSFVCSTSRVCNYWIDVSLGRLRREYWWSFPPPLNYGTGYNVQFLLPLIATGPTLLCTIRYCYIIWKCECQRFEIMWQHYYESFTFVQNSK